MNSIAAAKYIGAGISCSGLIGAGINWNLILFLLVSCWAFLERLL